MGDSSSVNSAAASGGAGEIVVLNRDLFFGVTIGNTLRSLGYRARFVRTTDQLVAAVRAGGAAVALALIDLNAGVAWDHVATLTNDGGPGVPVLVFGSHLDVEGRRAAKAAGAIRVVSNGDFHRDMPGFVRRYARPAAPAGPHPSTA